jgi:hypothetical protein
MKLTQLKERVIEQFKAIWVRIQESSTFEKLQERYYELSPSGQKAVIYLSTVTILLFILLIPFLGFQSSQDNVSIFEENVQTLRDLLRVQRELAGAPQVDDPPPPSQLKSMVQDVLNQAGLSQEQIKGNNELSPDRDPKSSLVPASVIEQGVEITLFKLNLKQVVDIGTRLSQLNRNVHLTAMDMKANAADNHYYDVIYRLMGFTINSPPPSPSGPTKPGVKNTPKDASE